MRWAAVEERRILYGNASLARSVDSTEAIYLRLNSDALTERIVRNHKSTSYPISTNVSTNPPEDSGIRLSRIGIHRIQARGQSEVHTLR